MWTPELCVELEHKPDPVQHKTLWKTDLFQYIFWSTGYELQVDINQLKTQKCLFV